jgi:hypothetical protein
MPRTLAGLGAGLLVAVSTGAYLSGQTATAAAVEAADRALLSRYCVTCHNAALKTGGLVLDPAALPRASEQPELWEKVVRKLRAGMMPPAGRPRPDRTAHDGFLTRLEGTLDRAAAAHPDPGRTEPFHRLNRIEYQNAVRDLLGLDIDAAAMLPPDDASYGFDNIAGILKTSPTLLERYLSAANRVSRLAVGSPVARPNVDTVTLRDDYPQDQRLEGLPFGTRGGTRFRYTFPLDGEYVVQVRLSRRAGNGANEDVPRFDDSHDLEVSIDDVPVGLFTLAGQPAPARRPGPLEQPIDRTTIDAGWEVRLPIKAGVREIEVAFLKRSAIVDERQRLPFLRPIHYSDGRSQPFLGKVTIVGPFAATGPGDTPSRRRIFVCQPSAALGSRSCARTILSHLAHRAYRRPITDEDVEPLVEFFDEGSAEGGFDGGIQRALELLLASPAFLFRVERDPAGVAPGTPYRISNLELASRLSFFLWSSIPDEALLEAAERGVLQQPEVLRRQVRRMMADERSRAFVQNFAGQWLFLRNLPTITPDPRLFPDFDEGLRDALRQETELLFDSILRENRSAVELLTADYTFVNERLARHYGIPRIKGNHFRRVPIASDERRGLLGQGSILTVTAYPHRTSPVLRGKWLLENLLGTPPPPPPPDVPPLVEPQPGSRVPSMRERMAGHRSNPVCASCHAVMDPPGLSLEQFDAIGRWRTLDESYEPIDASGVLPDGTKYEGAAGLRQALVARSDQFVRTLTEKLLTYALGRGVEAADAPAVRSILRAAARDDYRLTSIVGALVESQPFLMRRSRRADDH